ncbi:hypothetical protein IWQ60_006331 [Tieghemiomyces parasiticus]|uniref:E2 ubiquitin-conjugating enzyme n=1 Tax=Tieghemiomyces parasiticus TaxID=78921 RepID=A0A9W8AAN0_9FUNG|nr:hypothetical protein IWQ60_006331 [Tieghemiomyces parasiticus]
MENFAPTVVRRIAKELQALQQSPPEGIRVLINEENLADIQAWIAGPAGTPYHGGYFKVKLQLGSDFPNAPPQGYFVTKIFHPNVSASGEVCVNTLKKDWKQELGISHILLTVKCLLIVPNPESALNEEAGKLLLERYDDYAQHAQLMTQIHAAQVPPGLANLAQEATGGSALPTSGSPVSTSPAEVSDKVTAKAPEAKKKALDKKKKALKRL